MDFTKSKNIVVSTVDKYDILLTKGWYRRVWLNINGGICIDAQASKSSCCSVQNRFSLGSSLLFRRKGIN